MERRGVLLILCFLFGIVCSSENVPVLIWNTEPSSDVNFPAISALQQISVPSLQARYFDDFQPKNILLFLQDALSIEDLSSHGSELQHVSEWMEAGRSLYLPNVVQPAQLQHQLAQQGYKVTSLSAGSAVSELKLEAAGQNLVLVKLPPTLTNPSRSRALRKADEVMQSVLSKVGSLADFTVIYTALQPSVEHSGDQSNEENDAHARITRSLQQFGTTPVAPANYHFINCVKMYFRNPVQLSLDASTNQYDPLPEETATTEDPVHDCDGNEQMIRLKYAPVDLGGSTYSSVVLTFHFTLERFYWRASTVDVAVVKNANDPDNSKTLYLKNYNYIAVPVGKSYSCTPPLNYRENATTGNIELIINGFQAEAFIDESRYESVKFSDAWDCVGFFTIGIWCGLLASLLLVFILSVGLAFLANIKTMDRFDDPKGKTIVVPNSQD